MPIDRDKVLSAAQKFVEKRRFDKAIVEYQKLIQDDPNDARTLLKIGDLQSKMEAHAEAVATYDQVGKLYAKQGFALKAVAVFKQIRDILIKHVPQLEERYAHVTPKLAELYVQLGLINDALASFDEVATRLQRQGRDAEAIEVFKKIAELDPTNPLPHLRLAEALSRVKDTDGAVSEFAAASTLLVKLGRREDALKVIERLLHHKPDPSHARVAAELYLARNQQNDGLQALAKLQICFQANPKDLDTLSLLARAFTVIGQTAKAIEVQKEMARLAREQGKTELFRQVIEKLLRLAPNDEAVRRLVMGSEAPPRAMAPSSLSQVSVVERPDTSVVELSDDSVMEAFESLPSQAIDNVAADRAIQIAEEVDVQPSSTGDSRQQLLDILSEAESYRASRAYGKAIEALRIALEMAPRSLEGHESLRDVFLEMGQEAEAVEEMLALASLQIDALDGEGAAQTLQEVLALDGQNAHAAELLVSLGYAWDDAPDVEARDSYVEDLGNFDEPYDLEEVGTNAEALRTPLVGSPLVEMDDPFAEPPPMEALPDGERRSGFGVPSEPFDDVALERQAIPPPPDLGASDAWSEETDDDVRARNAATTSPPPVQPEIEGALEEVEFFVSRGLYDDARAILEEQLARSPNHPLILERLADLDSEERGLEPVPVDRSFDIAASLGALDEQGPGPLDTSGRDSEQIDVEALFAQFKEGVAQQASVDDGQSHYDLGLAYREMGRTDDAIREFAVAASDPKRQCVCQSMIGTIEMERGRSDEAIAAFMLGLRAEQRTSEQEMVLEFEIGVAHEAKRSGQEAQAYYQRVARRDPNYRDVSERIRRLSGAAKPAPKAAAVVADDEFDRAFDDILGDN